MEVILLIKGIFKLVSIWVGDFIAWMLRDNESEDNETLGAVVIALTLSVVGFVAFWLR